MICSRRTLAHPLFLALAFASVLGAQAPVQTKPFDRANLDTTCAPCEDFYSYANGGWLQRAKIPADYSTYGAFDQLFDQNQALLREILDTSVVRLKEGQYQPGTNDYKMAAFFSSCMDTVAIERLGATPLKPALDRIAAINSVADLKLALGELEYSYGLAPISEGSAQDAKDAAIRLPVCIRAACRYPTTSTTPRAIPRRQTFAPGSSTTSRGHSDSLVTIRPGRKPRRTPSSLSRRSSRKYHGRRSSCVMSSTITTA